MPRLPIFPNDIALSGSEKLLASDRGRTVNIPLSALAGFITTADLELGVTLTSDADNQITIQFTENGVALGDPQTVELSVREVNYVDIDESVDGQVTIQFQYDADGDPSTTNENIGSPFILKDGAMGLPGAAGGFGNPIATSLPAGSTPTVTATGPNNNKIFTFGIPRGADGSNGMQGVQGSYYVKAFTRSATMPASPNDLIWTEATRAFTGSSALIWGADVPTGTEQSWEVQALFNPLTSQTQISEWGNPYHAGGDGPKGDTGMTGAAAGYGTVTAVTGPIGVTTSGPDTAKNFTFSIPQGAQGIQGDPGATGMMGDQGLSLDDVVSSRTTTAGEDVGGIIANAGDTAITLQLTDGTTLPEVLIRRGAMGTAGTAGAAGSPGDTVTVTETGGVVTIASSGGSTETVNDVEAGGAVLTSTPEINSITIGGVVYAFEGGTHPSGGVVEDTFWGVDTTLPTAGLSNVHPIAQMFQATTGSDDNEVLGIFDYTLADDSPLDQYIIINLPDTLTTGVTVNFQFGNTTEGPFFYNIENVHVSNVGSTAGYTTYAFGFGADTYVRVHLT